ncbi:hypothetical protein Talka_00393 [Tepidimonas alkaliphilus]|uniref:Replication-associated protein ORF2/G2P domain-containing protein n=1 Tax=Tepidimonas alkaliphilus TaxID=2588942 RepID=A0A554WDP9_9BURK|nr:hypothetical protein [Tepidimonas alkaliphilus]TSE21707.1 hypothetical protein Talka_00387 [Tepidimonas alkaliphilus]TSE21713.1 hypothetical protein Talka_00393 [Tepidimonas alkaliphilus]
MFASDRFEHGAVAATAGAHARSAGQPAGAAAGLVSSETTVRVDSLPESWIPVTSDKVRIRERRIRRLRRNVWAAGRLLRLSAPRDRVLFVTLTYDTRGTLGRGAHDWQPCHIKDALKRYRRWANGVGIRVRYVWVAELQQSGTMHYHLAIWVPRHVTMPKWDKAGPGRGPFWPHGMTRTEVARDAVGYLMKYMSKIGGHHDYPKGARIYGIGGLDQSLASIRSWLNLPEWCKALYGVGELITRSGRRVVRQTGEVLASPWRRVSYRGQLFLCRVGEVAARWFDGPYSKLSVSHA